MSTTILQAGPNTPIATPEDVAAVAADLRYRIASAGYATTGAKLPDGVTVRMDGEAVSYKIESFSLPRSDTVNWRMVIAGAMAFVWDEDGTNRADGMLGYKFYDANGDEMQTIPALLVPRALVDRAVNLITATDETSIDIELPAAVTVDGVRYCRDFLLDVDNSANASDLALEFTALGVDYALVPLEDDSVSEMMTIGAGERVRLYFTETPYITSTVPVINVARVTLGDFVTSTATTQGGN